jgi:hypothetical protein
MRHLRAGLPLVKADARLLLCCFGASKAAQQAGTRAAKLQLLVPLWRGNQLTSFY